MTTCSSSKCKSPPAPNRRLCERHLALTRESQQRRRARFAATKTRCTNCGIRPRMTGRRSCFTCRAPPVVRVCENCTRQFVMGKGWSRYCHKCRPEYARRDKMEVSKASSKRIRERHLARGLCPRCGEPPGNGIRLCRPCADYLGEVTKRRRRRLIAARVCPVCGKAPAAGGNLVCVRCAVRVNNNSRLYRERKSN